MVTSAPGNAAAMDWPRAPLPAPISTCSTLGRLAAPLALLTVPLVLLLLSLLSLSTGPASPLEFTLVMLLLSVRFRGKKNMKAKYGVTGRDAQGKAVSERGGTGQPRAIKYPIKRIIMIGANRDVLWRGGDSWGKRQWLVVVRRGGDGGSHAEEPM